MITAIVNPAAGGGRCGREVDAALARLRAAGLEIEERRTAAPGEGVRAARAAYDAGARTFVAVGGDGTAHEVVNGIAGAPERCALGFLPLGTGNSFLRDFTGEGLAYAERALAENRRRACDVLRLEHDGGELFSLNLLCLGFPADVAAARSRRFRAWGPFGYVLGVLACLARPHRRPLPHRLDDDAATDRTPCLFLGFHNSKYTGGGMKIAPDADPCDGAIEYTRFGRVGRWTVVRQLPRLFRGTHLAHPAASRRAVRRVAFDLDGPVDVMVDGEVVTVRPRALEIRPGALDVLA